MINSFVETNQNGGGQHLDNFKKIRRKKMKTFTAKIRRKGETTFKYKENAAIIQNVLVQFDNSGRKMKFFYDSEKIKESGLDKEYVRSWDEKNSGDLTAALSDPEISPLLIRLDSENFEIVNLEEEKLRKAKEESTAIAEGKKEIHIGGGFFGYTISERINPEIWNKIKKYASYCKADEGDMEFLDDQGYYNVSRSQVKGWYYQQEAIQVLIDLGLKVSYKENALTSISEIQAIDNKIKAEEEKARAEYNAEQAKKEELSDMLRDLINNNSDFPSAEECDKIEDLDQVKIGNHEGANIYGGGSWFHIDEKNLYYVRNNGSDGDDWSRNNYQTGGAGAICYRIPLEKAKAYITEMQYFYKQTFSAKVALFSAEEQIKKDFKIVLDQQGFDIDISNSKIDKGNCLLVEHFDKGYGGQGLWFGLSLDKKTFFIGTRQDYYEKHEELWREFGNWFYKGNHAAQISIPANDELIKLFQSYLPEWVNKKQPGRFSVNSYICTNSENAIYAAWWHRYPLNVISNRLNVTCLTSEYRSQIWSDGVKTNELESGEWIDKENETTRADIRKFFSFEDVEIASAAKMNKAVRRLAQFKLKGFSVSELSNAIDLETKSIDGREFGNRGGVSLSKMTVKFKDGEKEYYGVESVYVAPPDQVDEYEYLFNNLAEAKQEFASECENFS